MERLGTYGDLLAWAEQAGVLDAGSSADLRRRAKQNPREAARALVAARALRESLYAVFASLAAGSTLPEQALAHLNGALPEALAFLRLEAVGDAVTWRWALAEAGLEGVLAPVVGDAAELLTSPEAGRVRECESDTCAWLFLDQSRNRSRRWCDMSTCGNRAKARRHYQRSKEDSRLSDQEQR